MLREATLIATLAGATPLAGALTLTGSLPTEVALASAASPVTGRVAADATGQTAGFVTAAAVRAAAACVASFFANALALNVSAVPFLTSGVSTVLCPCRSVAHTAGAVPNPAATRALAVTATTHSRVRRSPPMTALPIV